MPLDSMPRILVGFSTMPFEGMVAPGGAKTPSRPVRALGAPQTTCSTFSSPSIWASTLQSFNLSASGCFTASMIFATRNTLSASAGLWTSSTSRPIMVSLRVISSREAVVSRWSFNQDRVNFMRKALQQGSECRARKSRNGATNANQFRRRRANPGCRISTSRGGQCPCRMQSLGIFLGPCPQP